MLLMKKQYFGAIRAGRKTTTLRYWLRPHVRAGTEHLVPGLGRIRVDAVQAVEAEALGEDEARADGFPSLAALRAALGRLYPSGRRDGRRLYLVRFVFLGADSARLRGAAKRQ